MKSPQMAQLLIKAFDNNKEILKITILDAMKMLVLSWKNVAESTVRNCFAKAGISKGDQVRAQNDVDDSFLELQIDLKEM